MATKRLKYIKEDGTKVYQFIAKLSTKNASGNYNTKSTMYELPKSVRASQITDTLSAAATEWEKRIKALYVGFDTGNNLTPTSTFGETAQRWLENLEIEDKSLNHRITSKQRIFNECQPLLKIRLDNLTKIIVRAFFDKLDRRTHTVTKVIGKKEAFREAMKSAGESFTTLRKDFPEGTICAVLREDRGISLQSAERLAKRLGVKPEQICTITQEEKRYAHKTNHLVKETVRMVLTFATQRGLIAHNYARSEFVKYPNSTKEEPRCMTVEQMKKVCKAAQTYKDIRIGTLVLLFLLTGMRRGEVRGLKWKSISEKSIKVVDNVVDVYDNGHFIREDKEPKTKRSKRVIAIPEALSEQLAKYREYYLEQKAIHGARWTNDENYLFVNWDTGEPVAPGTLGKMTDKITKSVGLGHWNMHAFRHTNISVKLLNGVPDTEVSADAGHSSLQVTRTVYAHDINKLNRVAPAMLDAMLTEDKTSKCEIIKIDEHRA